MRRGDFTFKSNQFTTTPECWRSNGGQECYRELQSIELYGIIIKSKDDVSKGC